MLLTTEDNKIVEKTHCSSNGFYLLPIYDKKSFIIKVKPTPETKFGKNKSSIFILSIISIIEPEYIKLDLSKKSIEEIRKAAEASYNFYFVGFQFENQVFSNKKAFET